MLDDTDDDTQSHDPEARALKAMLARLDRANSNYCAALNAAENWLGEQINGSLTDAEAEAVVQVWRVTRQCPPWAVRFVANVLELASRDTDLATLADDRFRMRGLHP
ncbi:hypothetical protein KUV47_09205 [Vannielia litorea]|uniref:hypothetical protein n=1 Tax=Vannielia litorea TaxID=1217970 RepID=UPI001C944CE0|nr:hypothetical protein [Vannielia litorea]MBY6153386.1 hypothetical protein [Vannielia litorea]